MNDHQHNVRFNRRELIRGALRCVALGGITVLSAHLISRAGRTTTDDDCRRTVACCDCEGLSGCRLPRAVAAKVQHVR